MRLNRARALMLVSSLAVGCTINQVADDDGDDEGSAGESNAGSGGSGKGGSGGKGGSAGKGGSSGGAGEASAGESSSGAPGAGGEATGSGGAGDGSAGEGVGGDGSAGETTGTGGASAGAGGDGMGGEAGGATTCDDDAGTVATCDALADLSSCGIQTFVEGTCAEAETYLKPRVANAERECMLALDSTELCDATNTYGCLNDALLGSCPDSTAAEFCESLATECGGTVPENCETYVSGLTSEGRAQFTACVADGWCDLYICVESLGTY